VLKGVIGEIADALIDKLVVVPSNPLAIDAQGNLTHLLPEGQSSGEEVERLIRTAGFEPVKVGGIEQSSRLEVGGDLHDLVVGPAEGRSLIGGAAADARKEPSR
jgi:8-hydroxy-5-deazaflavin:NADPH oxidoreductase